MSRKWALVGAAAVVVASGGVYPYRAQLFKKIAKLLHLSSDSHMRD